MANVFLKLDVKSSIACEKKNGSRSKQPLLLALLPAFLLALSPTRRPVHRLVRLKQSLDFCFYFLHTIVIKQKESKGKKKIKTTTSPPDFQSTMSPPEDQPTTTTSPPADQSTTSPTESQATTSKTAGQTTSSPTKGQTTTSPTDGQPTTSPTEGQVLTMDSIAGMGQVRMTAVPLIVDSGAGWYDGIPPEYYGRKREILFSKVG